MKITTVSTIKAGAAAILAFAAMPAFAALPIYPSAGTQNPTPYTITAATNGNVLAYFASNTGGFTNLLGLQVNGIDTGILGLNNQTSTPGDVLDFGLVNAGDVLTFYINVTNNNDFWYSNKALNSDGVNHVWSTSYAGGDFGIPAGQFMTFEDLPGGGDFNYDDLGFVFTNVAVTPGAVPEPASWVMLIAGFGLVGAAMRRRPQVSVTYA
jgi:PEP-CTERM motif